MFHLIALHSHNYNEDYCNICKSFILTVLNLKSPQVHESYLIHFQLAQLPPPHPYLIQLCRKLHVSHQAMVFLPCKERTMHSNKEIFDISIHQYLMKKQKFNSRSNNCIPEIHSYPFLHSPCSISLLKLHEPKDK